MEDIYSFLVSEDEFERLQSGLKTVHLFINLPKYKALAEENVITFVSETEQKKQDAVIESLMFFPSVTDAFEHLGKEKCGYKASQTFEKASDIFLSNENYEHIEKYGVGAILIKKNDKK